MKVLTFLQWARKQRKRDDPVGDFCRDFAVDPERKRLENHEILGYLVDEKRVSENVLLAFDTAWVEWGISQGMTIQEPSKTDSGVSLNGFPLKT